ncbi:MAG: nuclear transport factor 2 family protein [Betaproteobacteria bacterium]
MGAAENKSLMVNVFAEMAKGNRVPFRDCLAEDVTWIFKGSTKWTGTYRGKVEVLTRLLGPIFAQFADEYTSHAQRFIADEDYVVVESQGRVTTRAGKPYHNQYCYVCRFRDGKVTEITEYMDTALADAVLADPD